MIDFLFYFFAAIVVLASLCVVLNRDVVGSAMFMILAFLGTAGLFVLLDAYFLAALEVLVYAGAVMVLFLFIIMLLDVDKQAQAYPKRFWAIASVLGFAVLIAGACYLFLPDNALNSFSIAETPVTVLPSKDAPMAFTISAKSFGIGLFTRYLLPFQIAGFILLVAMIGVVVISKRLRTDNVYKPPLTDE